MNATTSGITDAPAAELARDAHGMRETLKQEGRGIVRDAKDEVQRMADQRKTEAASLIRDVADALQQATSKLSDQGHGRVAEYAEVAADKLKQVSDELPSRDLGQMLQQVNRFAHDRPAVFVGALFVAGFAAARFLKASAAGDGDAGTSVLPAHRYPDVEKTYHAV